MPVWRRGCVKLEGCMTDYEADPLSAVDSNSGKDPQPVGKWPAGTSQADRVCWVCKGPTIYHQCKIVCQACGFMRDCSDP